MRACAHLQKKSVEEANILDRLGSEVEEAKKGFDDFNMVTEEVKERALSADQDVHDFRRMFFRSCKQTHSIISWTGSVRENWMPIVNLLKSRSEMLEQETSEPLGGLRAGVGTREGLVDQAHD